MKLDPICITKQKFRFANEGERDLEKKRTDKIPYSNLCYVFLLYLMLLSLSCLSFFSSLYVFALCVYFLSFCVSRQPFSFFLFLFMCVPLSIYREILKKLFPYFSLNWSDHGAVFVSFPSTTPNFMLSRHPLFSLFLFYLFHYFFSSFLVCDIPTFQLLRPNFIKPCSLEVVWMSDFHNL